VGALPPGTTHEAANEIVSPLDPLSLEDRIERFEPLERFLRIFVARFSHRPLPIFASVCTLCARERLVFVAALTRTCASSPPTMISSLRTHRAHLPFKDIDRPGQRDLGLFITLVRDELPSFGLAADLCLGRAMLMVVAALDVYDDVDQIFLPLAELLDSCFRSLAARRGKVRHHMPLNIHQANSPSFV
jgi:hypothetical protein